MESLPYDDMPDCCCKGMEDNKKIQQENTELKSQLKALQAHVERLSNALNRYSDETHIMSLLNELPEYSLNHIEARVEEETIERHRAIVQKLATLASYDEVRDACGYIDEELDASRKYAKQEKKEVSDVEFS